MARILFPGREAVGDHHIQALAFFADAVARGAEIQQLDHAISGNKNVFRLDIPVDDPPRVDVDQCVHDRREEQTRYLPCNPAVPVVYIPLEADAVNVLHGKVRGVVFLKIGIHAYDALIPVESRQRFCLIEEAGLAVQKILFPRAGKGRNAVSAGPRDKRVRKILLDGHQFAGAVVRCGVGDAEAALSEHPFGDVLSGQYRAARQRKRKAIAVLHRPALFLVTAPERRVTLFLYSPFTARSRRYIAA